MEMGMAWPGQPVAIFDNTFVFACGNVCPDVLNWSSPDGPGVGRNHRTGAVSLAGSVGRFGDSEEPLAHTFRYTEQQNSEQ